MKKIMMICMMLLSCCFCMAQEAKLTYVMTLHVKCLAAQEVGATAMGKRIVIPIVGGYFEGNHLDALGNKLADFKGEVLAGGADYQLVDTVRNRTHLEAIYNVKTSDGVMIHVRNVGVLANPVLPDGKHGFYFNTTPVFEAPINSPYAWLNDAIFVCTPFFEKDTIGLKVWRVN